MNLSHLPLRLSMGAFILNSGLSKWNMEGQAAEATYGMAVGAIPQLRRFSAATFARLLAGSEIALGTALLLPIVPSALAGTGLVGFSGGLMRLYWKTPGLHEPGDPRPTQQGVPIAKDVWMLGAGLTLVLDDLAARGRGLGKRHRRPAGHHHCHSRHHHHAKNARHHHGKKMSGWLS